MISENKGTSSKVETLMKYAGSIASNVLVGVFVFVFTIWLGNIHILNFNWLLLALTLAQVAMTVFLVWYCRRTINKVQMTYQVNVGELKDEQTKFQLEYVRLVQQDRDNWNKWAISFVEKNAEEQKERSEAIRREYNENIDVVKKEFRDTMHYYYTLTSDWEERHQENAHASVEKSFITELRRLDGEMKSLEGKLRDAAILEDS